MSKIYAQIAKEIASLQAEASKLFAAEAKEAVHRVNAIDREVQLSAQDLRFAEAPSAASAAVKKSPATVKFFTRQGLRRSAVDALTADAAA